MITEITGLVGSASGRGGASPNRRPFVLHLLDLHDRVTDGVLDAQRVADVVLDAIPAVGRIGQPRFAAPIEGVEHLELVGRVEDAFVDEFGTVADATASPDWAVDDRRHPPS